MNRKPMTFEEFQMFVEKQSEFLRTRGGSKQTRKEWIYSRTIKFGEEYGELCSEVLSSVGDQRKSKLKKADRETLEDEFSDCLIVLFLLAKALDVDIMRSVGRKAEKIQKKHNKEL
jgi:NTP pyrophosphatase (non-canonical NTP hydrolase)